MLIAKKGTKVTCRHCLIDLLITNRDINSGEMMLPEQFDRLHEGVDLKMGSMTNCPECGEPYFILDNHGRGTPDSFITEPKE